MRRTIVGCTLLVLCVAATQSTAQSDSAGRTPRGWYSVGATEPGIWANIASHPNGTIYIGSSGGWVRKSTDYGATWTTLSNGLPPGINSFAMDAASSDVIYAGALSVIPGFLSGVYKSSDGGATWLISDAVAGVPLSLEADPNRPGVVFVGALGGFVRRTIDGGTTWTTTFTGTSPVGSVQVDPSNSDRVYMATLAGAYVSLNGGMNWTKLAGLTAPNVWGIGIGPLEPNVIYAATNDDGIFQSVDSGVTWSNVSPPLTAYNVSVDPEDPNYVYAATRTGMWWSSDHGRTWRPRGLRKNGVFSVVAHANGTVHAGTPIGAEVSTDRGATWSSLDPGLGGSHAFGYAITVDPNNPKKLFTSQLVSTITVSHNGGETWHASDKGYLARAARVVNVDPTDSSRVYAGSFYAAGLYKSRDGGVTWQRRLFGSPSVYVWVPVVDPIEPNIVYAGTQGDGMWKSLDYGDSWTKLVGLTPGTVQGITVDPGNNRRVFVATPQGVFKSEDGGGMWTNVLPRAAWSVTFVAPDSDVVYATSKMFGVYKSNDRGMNWFDINTGITNLTMGRSAPVLVDPENVDILYTASEAGGGVYKSKDGGASWYQINVNLADTSVYGLAMDPERPKTLYVSGPTGVYKTITGGE
jgi:photosystem II stability/assembly factor-like uncharacterized protein